LGALWYGVGGGLWVGGHSAHTAFVGEHLDGKAGWNCSQKVSSVSSADVSEFWVVSELLKLISCAIIIIIIIIIIIGILGFWVVCVWDQLQV
jgi:hypothetical protein